MSVSLMLSLLMLKSMGARRKNKKETYAAMFYLSFISWSFAFYLLAYGLYLFIFHCFQIAQTKNRTTKTKGEEKKKKKKWQEQRDHLKIKKIKSLLWKQTIRVTRIVNNVCMHWCNRLTLQLFGCQLLLSVHINASCLVDVRRSFSCNRLTLQLFGCQLLLSVHINASCLVDVRRSFSG